MNRLSASYSALRGTSRSLITPAALGQLLPLASGSKKGVKETAAVLLLFRIPRRGGGKQLMLHSPLGLVNYKVSNGDLLGEQDCWLEWWKTEGMVHVIWARKVALEMGALI